MHSQGLFDLAAFMAITSIALVIFDKDNKYHFVEAMLFIFLIKYRGVSTVRLKVARLTGYIYIALLLYIAFSAN